MSQSTQGFSLTHYYTCTNACKCTAHTVRATYVAAGVQSGTVHDAKQSCSSSVNILFRNLVYILD